MSTRTIIVVLLALVCGASAAIGVSQIGWHPELGLQRGEGKAIVTAVADIPRGQVIEAKMLKVSRYEPHDVPKGAIAAVDEVVGRTAIVPLVTGEPVLASKLAEKGSGRGMAAMIPDGMRAFTIQTPHVAAGGGGFIMPGNRVDVLLTTLPSGPEDATGGGVTTTLLQNLQVLAVAQKLEAPQDSKIDPNEFKSVTLLVTPNQAAKLDLGMNKGLLHLALRNHSDDREAATIPATMRDLRFYQEKPPVVASADSTKGMQVNAPVEPPVPPLPTRAEVQQASYMEIQTLRGMDAGTIRFPVSR